MNQLQSEQDFRDLIAYQKARAMAKRVFEISKRFPREELYSLTDQTRRSSRSVGAQITQAWAKRRYEKLFLSDLTKAEGEQQETQHLITTAADCGYLSLDEAGVLDSEMTEIGRLLKGMIENAGAFCGEPSSTPDESTAHYFATADMAAH